MNFGVMGFKTEPFGRLEMLGQFVREVESLPVLACRAWSNLY